MSNCLHLFHVAAAPSCRPAGARAYRCTTLYPNAGTLVYRRHPHPHLPSPSPSRALPPWNSRGRRLCPGRPHPNPKDTRDRIPLLGRLQGSSKWSLPILGPQRSRRCMFARHPTERLASLRQALQSHTTLLFSTVPRSHSSAPSLTATLTIPSCANVDLPCTCLSLTLMPHLTSTSLTLWSSRCRRSRRASILTVLRRRRFRRHFCCGRPRRRLRILVIIPCSSISTTKRCLRGS